MACHAPDMALRIAASAIDRAQTARKASGEDPLGSAGLGVEIEIERRLPVAGVLRLAYAPVELRAFGDDEVLLHDVAVDARRRMERNGFPAQLAVDLAVDRKIARDDMPVTLPVSLMVMSSPWMSPATSPEMTSALLQTSVIR